MINPLAQAKQEQKTQNNIFFGSGMTPQNLLGSGQTPHSLLASPAVHNNVNSYEPSKENLYAPVASPAPPRFGFYVLNLLSILSDFFS